jgi:hypothetical protein
MHTLIVHKLLERARAPGRERLLDLIRGSLCSAPGILGCVFDQSIMHAFVQEQADGSERASGTGVERHMVMSGQEQKEEHKPPCAGRLCCLALFLSVARDLPEPREFRCPAHVRVRTAAHEAARRID